MRTDKTSEIERLVSEVYDDGLDGDVMRRLEELLIDDPAAQQHYWQLVDTHVALSAIVGPTPSRDGSPSERSATAVPARAAGLKVRASGLLRRHPWWLAAAAAVLVAGLVGLYGTGGTADVNPLEVASPSPWSAVEEMPVVTRVSWEGPSFASDSKSWQPARAGSAGAVTLPVREGDAAGGYLFCLMPGDSVKLMATFDATGENSLSVVELLGGGRPAVRKVSFHNAGGGPKPLHANPWVQNRRYGILGHWSESNVTPRPRYFLLTGLHKLARPTPHESWRLSRIAVLVESSSVVSVGWDDSGPAPNKGRVYREDFDYDDLTASLFFDRHSEEAESPGDDIQVIANQQESAVTISSPPEGGYLFELPPRTASIVKAASEASASSAILVVDASTHEVLWSSSKEHMQPTNLGAACLVNPTTTVRRVQLIGIHMPRGSDGTEGPWRMSRYETLYEQPGFIMVGFDDWIGDNDFDDVRVDVLTTAMPESHSL